MSKPVNPADIRRSAMDLLARREHSGDELRQKLRRRFGSDPDIQQQIDAQLDRLIDEGLLSDERYAAAMVRQHIGRGLGPRRVDQELRAKGIRDTWEACADDSEREIDWFERARDVYLKKFGYQALPQEQKARQKEWARRARFMQYRGFEPDHFMALLEGNIDEVD